jgi:hypothetical protein
MPNGSQSRFEASIEELAGIGKNPRFDEVIDDENYEDIRVICRRGDEEIPLAKPSRAFYFGDRTVYVEESQRFDQETKARILHTDSYRDNLASFEGLKRACQRGLVIPFVGAGMSVSAGCPEWGEYLISLCEDAGLDPDAMRARLEAGAYEGAMDDIFGVLGANLFNIAFERRFQVGENIGGAVTLLPKLFDGCAITTNFDRALETVYANDSKAFTEKVMGRGQAGAFLRAIPGGDRHLLKLHGNLDNAADRILSKTEYDAAYGNDGDIHFHLPLPKLLKRLFTSYTFLFLGCSLSADRTIQTFLKVAQDEGQQNLPHHYALLPCPTQPARRIAIQQRLADAHITPIWYPEWGIRRNVNAIPG